jgi:hypothetical protein
MGGATGVSLGVAVYQVPLGVAEGRGVIDGVHVQVGQCVAVKEGVMVGQRVAVAVGVRVAVRVGVMVGVGVWVIVGVVVGDGTGVRVATSPVE